MIEWWGWVLIVIGVGTLGALAQRQGWIYLRGDASHRGASGGGDLGVIQTDSDPDAGEGYEGTIRL